MSELNIRTPYLVFLGDAGSELDAKTGHGVADWRPEECVGQLRYANCKADTGLPDMDLRQAVSAGARSLLIGVAPTGGALKADWVSTLAAALQAGLDLVSGLHTPLADNPRLAHLALRHGRRLVDVRVPPEDIRVGTGKKRSGQRLLTVGTDCCVGKKYTALALHQAMRRAGMDASFRATGQTGILIAGGGMPIDAVVADFISGAAEQLSPAADPAHWDLIEGQGSLFHPGFAAVTLGLVHGSQPDALVLCHEAGRAHIDEHPDFPIPGLAECIEAHLAAARLTNPGARCIGVSLNCHRLGSAAAAAAKARAAEETGLPCVDPLADGVQALLERLTPS